MKLNFGKKNQPLAVKFLVTVIYRGLFLSVRPHCRSSFETSALVLLFYARLECPHLLIRAHVRLRFGLLAGLFCQLLSDGLPRVQKTSVERSCFLELVSEQMDLRNYFGLVIEDAVGLEVVNL